MTATGDGDQGARLPHRGYGSGSAPGGRGAVPEWSDGLKQLYDAVVEEALPDSFLELLARLDDSDAPGTFRGDGANAGRTSRPL